jgi:hypothetical protein
LYYLLKAPGEGTMKNFAVVRSLDAPGHISLDEFSTYTKQTAARMQAMGRSMPPVLLLQVSESVAAVLGVGRTGVIRHNRSENTDLRSYYEIWLVGKAGLADYMLALQGIFDDYFARDTASGPMMTQL